MHITTDHSASSYGQPVILDDDGDVMDYALGIKAVRGKLNLTTEQLAAICNVSRRTVEGWEQGRMPETAALNVMATLISQKRRKPNG
jgi:DNA-binding transcriptional regulator YiaG